MTALKNSVLLLFLFLYSSYFAQSDSESETWPLIVGYQKIIPVGKLKENMGAMDGFHAGFQFSPMKKYVFDMKIFAGFGGDENKKRIFTYKGDDYESYIKSIYGISASIQRSEEIIPKKLDFNINAGVGFQIYNSDKENKFYVKNAITGEYTEDRERKPEKIGSPAPLTFIGTGLKYKFKDFPIGFNIGYNFAPHNVFQKSIQKGTGNSYMTFSLYTGFLLPL